MAEIKANFVIKGWTANQLAQRGGQVMQAYRDVLFPQFKKEIEAVVYPWTPGVKTRRRNGTTVGSPRDIVDLGGLRRSQEVTQPNATTLRFTWNAKSDRGFMYAGLILTGYVRTGTKPDGTSISTPVPARNWIKPALDKYPLDRFFIQEWRRLARTGK